MKKSSLMLLAVLIFIAPLFSSCAATPNGYMEVNYGKEYNQYQIEIISDPPGAIIEWNNEYVGPTPVYKIINGGVGAFAQWQVTATPTYAGGCKQVKILDGGSPLPRKIYFNTNICS